MSPRSKPFVTKDDNTSVNWPSDFRGEPNDSEVGARHGREAIEDTVAAGMVFDKLKDNDGWNATSAHQWPDRWPPCATQRVVRE